jgi:hypothetical protein
MQPIQRYDLNLEIVDDDLLPTPVGEYVTFEDHEAHTAKLLDALQRTTAALAKVLAGDRDSTACADAHIRALSVLRAHGVQPADAPVEGA